jgi:hypothetical protein
MKLRTTLASMLLAPALAAQESQTIDVVVQQDGGQEAVHEIRIDDGSGEPRVLRLYLTPGGQHVQGAIAVKGFELAPGAEQFVIQSGAGEPQVYTLDLSSEDGAPLLVARLADPDGDRGYLGVTVATESDGRVAIDSVVRGSPAESGGLKAGDRILSVEGREITSYPELESALTDLGAGKRVSVEAQRGEERFSVTLTLADASVHEHMRVERETQMRVEKRKEVEKRKAEDGGAKRRVGQALKQSVEGHRQDLQRLSESLRERAEGLRGDLDHHTEVLLQHLSELRREGGAEARERLDSLRAELDRWREARSGEIDSFHERKRGATQELHERMRALHEAWNGDEDSEDEDDDGQERSGGWVQQGDHPFVWVEPGQGDARVWSFDGADGAWQHSPHMEGEAPMPRVAPQAGSGAAGPGLRKEIDDLRGELRGLREEIRALREALSERQSASGHGR